MRLHTVCKICGKGLTTEWVPPQPPPVIHPECDTRPPAEQGKPHPAEGKLAAAAHEATLAMAAASAYPDGAPQWREFDRACERVRTIQHNNQHVDLHKAARYYTDTLGWSVFPLEPGGKAPLTKRGFKDATVDPAKVDDWWARWPDANIGLPTGEAFAVIDVDTPIIETEWESLAADPELEAHGLSATAGGGYHLLVQPDKAPPKNGVNVLGPHIDIRTIGGYIVAPWSRRATGVWQWMSEPSPTIRQGR